MFCLFTCLLLRSQLRVSLCAPTRSVSILSRSRRAADPGCPPPIRCAADSVVRFFFFFSRVFFARGGLFSATTRQLDVSVRWTRRRRERCARREKNGLRTLLCHIKGSDSVLLLVMLGCSRGEERFCRRSAVPCRIFTQRSSLESNGVTCSWKAPQRFR